MRKFVKKAVALLVVCLIAIPAFSGAVMAEGDKEVVTIQYYGMQNNRSSMEGFMNDYLEEKIGVRVEVIPYDEEKTQSLLASGDLPDIGRYVVNNSIMQAIEVDLLMELTPYLDKVPNLSEKWPKAVDFAREVMCEGEGLYCFPLEIGTYNSYPIDTGTYAINLRWDVYEAIGAPQINNLDELIVVLKQMMEYMPESEDGVKTWGMAAFPEWDGGTSMSSAGKVAAISGVMLNVGKSYMEYDIRNDELREMLDRDSTYVAGVKFLFDCNQAGILDPDSVTQTYAATQAKLQSGAVMGVMAGNYVDIYNSDAHGNAENPSGYLPLVNDWIYTTANGPQQIGGGNASLVAVSASTDKLDACLAFINEMYDEETCLNFYNGPKGEMWDVVDGKLVSLDGFKTMRSEGSYTLASGEVLQTGQFWSVWGLTNDNPTQYGEPLRQTEWSSSALDATDSKIYSMWRETTGYTLPIEAYTEQGTIVYNSLASRLMPTMDEDMRMIQTSVGQVVVAESWKMACAENEEEFWSLCDGMKDKALALGLQDLYDWGSENWTAASDRVAEYAIK